MDEHGLDVSVLFYISYAFPKGAGVVRRHIGPGERGF